MRPVQATLAFSLSTWCGVGCMPTRHACTWGEAEGVPGACYTQDGQVWLDGEVITRDGGTDATDGDALDPEAGEGDSAGLDAEGDVPGADGATDAGDADLSDEGVLPDAGCERDMDCVPLTETPYCNLETRSCAGCIPRVGEREQCANDNACDPQTLTCTGRPRGTVNWCTHCITDTECVDGHRCVPMTFQGSPIGNYCLRVAPDASACPDQTPAVKRATSVLELEDDYCFPDELHATCATILDFRRICASNEECGADGVDDGICFGNPGAKRCTYTCVSEADCAEGRSCTGTAGARYCNLN